MLGRGLRLLSAAARRAPARARAPVRRALSSVQPPGAIAVDGDVAAAMLNVMSGSREDKAVSATLRSGGAAAAAEQLLGMEGEAARAVGPRTWHRVMEGLGGAPGMAQSERAATLRRLFHHMERERLVTARAVHVFLRVYGYTANSTVREVVSVLERMRTDYDLQPHLDTCNIVLGVCAWYGNLRGIRRVLRVIEREGHKPDAVTLSTLVQGYSRSQGARFEDALGAYREIGARGLAPSEHTLSNMLDACGKFGKFRMIGEVWRELTTDGSGPLEPNVDAYTALVEAQLRCGRFDQASLAFDAVVTRGLVPTIKMCTVFAHFCLGRREHRRRASQLLVEWGAPSPGVRRADRSDEYDRAAARFDPERPVDLESPAWHAMTVLLNEARRECESRGGRGGDGGGGGAAAAAAAEMEAGDDIAEARLLVWRWLHESGAVQTPVGQREVAFLGMLRGRMAHNPTDAMRVVVAYRQFLDHSIRHGTAVALETLRRGGGGGGGGGEEPPAGEGDDDRWE